LTQEFFARLLSSNYLSVADLNKGKFRSFLLGSLEHFLAREWTKTHAQKRGGGQPLFSLDEMDAQNRYLLEPAGELTAEKSSTGAGPRPCSTRPWPDCGKNA
jgi:hypothetical protein